MSFSYKAHNVSKLVVGAVLVTGVPCPYQELIAVDAAGDPLLKAALFGATRGALLENTTTDVFPVAYGATAELNVHGVTDANVHWDSLDSGTRVQYIELREGLTLLGEIVLFYAEEVAA